MNKTEWLIVGAAALAAYLLLRGKTPGTTPGPLSPMGPGSLQVRPAVIDPFDTRFYRQVPSSQPAIPDLMEPWGREDRR